VSFPSRALTLLIAPTGGGKTLAGFLPTLAELADGEHKGLHTLYISPLKALAADIRRNLTGPITEMGLPIRVEDRTGDTPTRKKRQRADPPHILLTTPESLALLTSYEDAPRMFAGLKRVIVDEIHALAESKRGDQLMLALWPGCQPCAPALRRVGLSATVEDPAAIARLLARHPDPCEILQADPGPDPDIAMLTTEEYPALVRRRRRYAIPEVLER
jgi:ATP-dependent Lhr-like helicase